MNKRSAAEKIAKLRRLADDPRTPAAEAESARKQIDKISGEHGIGEHDLEEGRMGAAFDDLVGEIEKVVSRHSNIPTGLFGTSDVIRGALAKVRSMPEADKVTRLRQIVTVVRTAAFIAGGNAVVAEAKAVVDVTLKNHGVSV